ncbi:hypothetical protein [Streptomyces wuyuanensis]|uniref:hypothetical protein n=1 Tax=Streptomyces wuyuanensis TaxID=1196353 RepID=UPI00342782E1
MSGKPTKTRKATAAERLAARFRGEKVPDLVVIPTGPSSGEQHLARLKAKREEEAAERPRGMSAAAVHAWRAGVGPAGEGDDPGPDAA